MDEEKNPASEKYKVKVTSAINSSFPKGRRRQGNWICKFQ